MARPMKKNYDPEVVMKTLMDAIIYVAESAKKSFVERYPQMTDKTHLLCFYSTLFNHYPIWKHTLTCAMKGASEKKNGEDGLPVPPYAVYNIGGGTPENLLDCISTLQDELVRAGVLPEDYDFEAHKELVGMQPGDLPVTYAFYQSKSSIQQPIRNEN